MVLATETQSNSFQTRTWLWPTLYSDSWTGAKQHNSNQGQGIRKIRYYVLIWSRDIRDVNITLSMSRADDCWTDHRLLLLRLMISIRQPRTHPPAGRLQRRFETPEPSNTGALSTSCWKVPQRLIEHGDNQRRMDNRAQCNDWIITWVLEKEKWKGKMRTGSTRIRKKLTFD